MYIYVYIPRSVVPVTKLCDRALVYRLTSPLRYRVNPQCGRGVCSTDVPSRG